MRWVVNDSKPLFEAVKGKRTWLGEWLYGVVEDRDVVWANGS